MPLMDAPLTPPTQPSGPNLNNIPGMPAASAGEVFAPAAHEAAPAVVPAAETAPAVGATPTPATAPATAGTPAAMPVAPVGGQAPAPVAGANPLATDVPLPAVAGDVDVIEAEWVDKAEAVVQKHLGDPYGEEEAVELLQEDYLKKRYGLDVAEPDGPSQAGPA